MNNVEKINRSGFFYSVCGDCECNQRIYLSEISLAGAVKCIACGHSLNDLPYSKRSYKKLQKCTGNFKCDVCKKKFRNLFACKMHMSEAHQLVGKPK